MRVFLSIKSWEYACDSADHIIRKVHKICARQWMLTDDYMETLGMPTFDELANLDPSNLKIVEVEEQQDQSVNIIQNINQLDIFSFILLISSPTQLRIRL